MGENHPPASVLTPRHREILQADDEPDISDRAKRAHRARMRERIEAGISDFSILLENLESDERSKIDESGMIDAMAFLLAPYFRTGDVKQRRQEIDGKKPGQYVTDGERVLLASRMLQKAINRVSAREFSVDISLKERDSRTPRELRMQLKAGEISPDDVEQLFREGMISRDTFIKAGEVFDEASGRDR